MRALLAAVFCALVAAAARAETRSFVAGPLALKGAALPMTGPELSLSQRFPRSGVLTRFSVHVLDESRAAADDRDLFCHAALGLGRSGAARARLYRSLGLDPLRLISTAEGQNEIVFPRGFGVRVDSTTEYPLELMLQSPDGGADGRYYFRVEYALADPAEEASVTPLEDVRVSGYVSGRDRTITGNLDWWVPPGRHEYARRFRVPFSGTVHYAQVHVHRYARRVVVRDPASGKELYAEDVVDDAQRRLVRVPVYSSAEGFPLAAGREYEAVFVYDNPTKKDIPAMGSVRFFMTRESRGS